MKTLVEKRSDVMKKVRYLGPKSWKEWRSEILMMRRRRLWLIMALISSLYMFWSKKSNKARLWLLLSSIFTATPSWFCCFCSLLFSSLLGLGLGFPRWKGENECGLLLFSRPSLALPCLALPYSDFGGNEVVGCPSFGGKRKKLQEWHVVCGLGIAIVHSLTHGPYTQKKKLM